MCLVICKLLFVLLPTNFLNHIITRTDAWYHGMHGNTPGLLTRTNTLYSFVYYLGASQTYFKTLQDKRRRKNKDQEHHHRKQSRRLNITREVCILCAYRVLVVQSDNWYWHGTVMFCTRLISLFKFINDVACSNDSNASK
jgi:hypothetical protein